MSVRHPLRALAFLGLVGVLAGCLRGVTLGGSTFEGEWAPPVRAAKSFLQESSTLRDLAGGAPVFELPTSISLTAKGPDARIVETSVRLPDSVGRIEVLLDKPGSEWQVVEATVRSAQTTTRLK